MVSTTALSYPHSIVFLYTPTTQIHSVESAVVLKESPARARCEGRAIGFSRLAFAARQNQRFWLQTRNTLPWVFGTLIAVLKWLIRLAALAALVLAILPTALSTRRGLAAGTALASRFLPGTLQIDEVSHSKSPQYMPSSCLDLLPKSSLDFQFGRPS